MSEKLFSPEYAKNGLSWKEVSANKEKYGLNIIKSKKLNAVELFLRQLVGNPLIIILSIAATISFLTGGGASSIFIFWMILISAILGFWNEYSAEKTVETLLGKISKKCKVLREGKTVEVNVSDVVLNDLLYIEPGDVVAADAEIIESKSLELNESNLTGESMPVFKKNGTAFMGTIVLGGWAKASVKSIGENTEYGKIAKNASFLKPETDFEKGLKGLGNLLVRFIFFLAVGIFLVNAIFGRDLLTSVMFSLAIAVGLTPELLPVIVTISLSHGAGKLAKRKVIARQLISIENLGNMDILCTDKTGTLTEGKIVLAKTSPKESKELVEAGLLCNSSTHEGKSSANPIDTAIWHYAKHHNITQPKDAEIIFEKPFDYEIKGMFVVNKSKNDGVLLAKGATEEILSRCSKNNPSVLKEAEDLNADGYRVLAVAFKKVSIKEEYDWNEVTDLTFMGFLCFMDTPKKSATSALLKLKNLSVGVKILTGDNEIVTRKIAQEVGLENKDILTGAELDKMSDEQVTKVINEVDIFARLSPEHKLRVIGLLRKMGHTVGFLGDGINDIPALHSCDVGISVDSASAAAKDASNIVILEKDLGVIAEGIIEGRKTFSNTLKYILMGSSSNFGNMFSAAGASIFLPFLPMTPVQILLNNTLYDFSQMTLPSDAVDEEDLRKPRHWDIAYIKKFMLFFGPISSLFDFITFGWMLWFFSAQEKLFQTGWFIQSIITQVLVVFVIRTTKSPFFKSKAGKWVVFSCLIAVLTAFVIPYTPLGDMLGFAQPPLLFIPIVVLSTSIYLGIVETGKKYFFKKFGVQ